MSDIEREPTERRPWGSFTVLDEGLGYKVKRIDVHPGGRLSLQSHKSRDEHWSIVDGTATVTVGDTATDLVRGQAIDISREVPHRLENFGSERVVVIEVQFGAYLGEDDIVRYEDVYDRS